MQGQRIGKKGEIAAGLRCRLSQSTEAFRRFTESSRLGGARLRRALLLLAPHCDCGVRNGVSTIAPSHLTEDDCEYETGTSDPCVPTLRRAVLGAHAKTSEKVLIDGSTGVAPLVQALAKAYRGQHPETSSEIGKRLGTKACIAALSGGNIDIAMARHGLEVAAIQRQGMAIHEIAKIAVFPREGRWRRQEYR